jgi:hypothetical protein
MVLHGDLLQPYWGVIAFVSHLFFAFQHFHLVCCFWFLSPFAASLKEVCLLKTQCLQLIKLLGVAIAIHCK